MKAQLPGAPSLLHSIQEEIEMSKGNNQPTIDKETIVPITDIPTHLALEAHRQGKTIRETQLIEQLTQFCIDTEMEGGIGIMDIETNVGLALADIAEALEINEPKDLLRILGTKAYLTIYVRPIPYHLAPQERAEQELRAAPGLLTKLQEIEGWITTKRKTRAKTRAKLKTKPSPPLPA